MCPDKFFINCISKVNVHAPAIGEVSIPGLLFADDLAAGSYR
jgi:hypothetical protein